MAEKRVDLLKNVFDKTQYSRTIDTSFRELGVTSIAEDLQRQPNVEEFFALYNELFYDIPPTGGTNSHQYLVIQSGEYIGFERNQEEIEALQNEISQLRKDLLAAQVAVVEAQTGETLNIDVDNISGNIEEVTQTLSQIQQDIQNNNNITS
jgi:hypothetical protein